MSTKNVKEIAARKERRPALSFVPPTALYACAAAMEFGAVDKQYGRLNWRETGASVNAFFDAMQRHLWAYMSGEQVAPDSRIHHLAHVMASCAILIDCEVSGILTDDRVPLLGAPPAPTREWFTQPKRPDIEEIPQTSE